MNDSYLLRQERCPICASEGKDRSGNNLAVYSDGHSYCYGGHGVVSRGDKVVQFTNSAPVQPDKHEVVLPEDCSTEYPERCLKWVGQYELTEIDLLNNTVLWSESEQRLLFPLFDESSNLIAYQGRWFGEGERVKWLTRGNLKDTFNLLGEGNKLVLTEDVVSAIKVAKCGVQAMPLYGCFVGIGRFNILRKLYGYKFKVLVWLDPDKRKESITESRRGQLVGLDCSPIFSDKDPKEMTYDQIKEILT